jgi:hypothetical protein
MTPSPQLNYATPVPRNDLRVIAVRQKAIMYCILGYIVAVICQFAVPPALRLFVVAPIGLAAIITGSVFVFMLAMAIYNTAAGIVMGICTLIPVVGLIILLIINSRATALLQSYGIKVGMMGADLAQIPDAGPPMPPYR